MVFKHGMHNDCRMMTPCQKKKLIHITVIFKYPLSCGAIIRLTVFNAKV